MILNEAIRDVNSTLWLIHWFRTNFYVTKNAGPALEENVFCR